MFRTVTLLGTLSLCIFVSTADAAWMITDTNNASTKLYDYTQGGGSATNPRTVSGIASNVIVVGIDFSGAGDLFALTTTSDNRLYKINPTTGVATSVGAAGGGASIIEGDIGFDPTSGILYGLYNVSGGQFLFTVNTTTGALTNVGTLVGDDPSGLAFDNAGNLFVVNTNINSTKQPQLLRVNKLTGATISTLPMGITVASPTLGLDFDPNSNTLYMAGGDGGFFSVNTTTGAATPLGNHNVFGAGGLAFVVPEPASAALLLAAAAPFFVRRRQRVGCSA